MHYKEITELAIEKNLLSHVGKSPEVTMGARLAALLKKEDKTNPIVRVKPGVFALREWDDKKGRRDRKSERPSEAEADSSTDVNALEVEAATREAEPEPEPEPEDDELENGPILRGEDALRADLAASGAELFDDEEDDDQPILATPPAAGAPAQHEGMPSSQEGGRRRRRRRRRGRGGMQGDYGGGGEGRFAPGSSPRMDGVGGPIQPSAIVSVDGD